MFGHRRLPSATVVRGLLRCSCLGQLNLVPAIAAAVAVVEEEDHLQKSHYTVALNLVPGDFRVHVEANQSPSEPFEVSTVKTCLGDAANFGPDQP